MSFSVDIKKFVEKAKKNPETVIRNVSLKLFSAVIDGSPVLSGRFRLNWQASGVVPAGGTLAGGDPSGAKAKAAMVAYITSAKDWGEFTLANNLPYALPLEYGYSKQAPAGMVRVNAMRFNALLAEEAAKVK